jgi:hypothetical protein
MNKFLALLKFLLKNAFGISALRYKGSKNRIEYLKTTGILLLVVAGITPTIIFYAKLLWEGYDLLAPLGQQGAILNLGVVMVSTLVFFFGIFYVINQFYLAGDAQSLLALPLRGWQVLGARFSVVLCYEYLTELVFILPPVIIYGYKSAASPFYWFYALLGFFLIPLLPLGLATIPSVILMRFANLGRSKDVLKILGGLIAVGFAIGLQIVFQKLGPNTADPAFVQNLLTDRNGLMNLIGRVFPSARYLGLALVNADEVQGLMNMLEFAGLSLLAVIVAWAAGDRWYFQGLIGSAEITSKRKKLTRSDYRRLAAGSPALWSYSQKEIHLLIRTPIYFINCVLTNILVPALIILPFWLQAHSQRNSPLWEEIMTNPRITLIIMTAITGVSIFLTATNAITSTSISREGKDFLISKYIPLQYKKQIQAKLISGYVFSELGALLLLIAVNIMFTLNLKTNLIILAVILVAIIPSLEIGLIIDILRPKLDWDNEQKAVKQNLNVILSMLASILLGGGIIYAAIRFFHDLNSAAIFMFGVFACLALILNYWLVIRGPALYREIEG